MESTRLFIIEPDADLNEAAAEGLSELGFAVQTETDPQQGLARLFDAESPSPHVVILAAPPLDDLTWFFDAAAAHQRTAALPIIVTPGAPRVSPHVLRRSAQCVWKPYTIQALEAAIDLALRRTPPLEPA